MRQPSIVGHPCRHNDNTDLLFERFGSFLLVRPHLFSTKITITKIPYQPIPCMVRLIRKAKGRWRRGGGKRGVGFGEATDVLAKMSKKDNLTGSFLDICADFSIFLVLFVYCYR